MLTRRQFLIAGSALLYATSGCQWRWFREDGPLVNDIHSQLNATRVARVVQPPSVEAVQDIISRTAQTGEMISIAGGRHAMGGQQFGAGTILLDMNKLNRVIHFDPEGGRIEVEAGIQWPELIQYLIRVQENATAPWGIIQKQTGADRLSLGGALAANVHGRGLALKPIIGDVESFVLVDASGARRTCSRQENSELFRLAIGGYGMFGVVTSITLRLAPRRQLERVVEVNDVDTLIPAFERRLAEGFEYGDFQYAIDDRSPDFLRKGVFSCYRPVENSTPLISPQKELSIDGWRRLLYLAHADKAEAFRFYSSYYLSTSGQRYWSDTHQLSVYLDDYHRWLDRRLGSSERATEMITEIYVPHAALVRFLDDVRQDFLANRVNVVYGTIRLIERDDESFLAWARERYACIIFNLHVVHNPRGLKEAQKAFQRLIGLGISYGGSYFLTYHRWASRQQVEACYPQFGDFLRRKLAYDDSERFQSEWYRHYRTMFQDQIAPVSRQEMPTTAP